MQSLSVWIALVSALAAGEQPQPIEQPTSVVARFFKTAVDGDVDGLIKLTAPVSEIAQPAIRPYFNRRTGGPARPIVAHLQLSHAAVVIFIDGPVGAGRIDLDPAYLVQRDGKWLVLFKLTQFRRPYIELTPEENEEFARLESWYKRQEEALQEILHRKP